MTYALDPLQPATLARWRTWLAQTTTLSPNTINRMLSAIKRLTAEAAEQGYLSHEVVEAFQDLKGVKRAALKERLKPNARTRIAPEQMRQLQAAPGQEGLRALRDAALLATLASSGLRVSEAASLTCRQIIQEGEDFLLLVRGKNEEDESRALLSREAKRLIDVWLLTRPVESAYVFTAFAGRGEGRLTARPLSARAIEYLVAEYARACKLQHVTPHDLRRFLGTILAKQDIRRAQKALRHKRIDTTATHYVLDELEPGLSNDLY
jgi:integrase/recombinase XerD